MYNIQYSRGSKYRCSIFSDFKTQCSTFQYSEWWPKSRLQDCKHYMSTKIISGHVIYFYAIYFRFTTFCLGVITLERLFESRTGMLIRWMLSYKEFLITMSYMHTYCASVPWQSLDVLLLATLQPSFKDPKSTFMRCWPTLTNECDGV